MIRIFSNANYDFIGYRKVAYAVTALIAIPGLSLLLFRGLNYSIEFTGGTLVQVTALRQGVSIGGARAALERGGLHGAEITTFGADHVFVVRARLSETDAAVQEDEAQATAARVTQALEAAYGEGSFRLDRREAVGPKVGGELRTRALLAIMLSLGAVLIYLAVRFEWRFGLAAVVATTHDMILTLAFISYMNLEVSLVVVSAMLTVIGYSLNDTIVVFDRTRENLKKYRRDDLAGVLNRSVNETLPRTILTNSTVLSVILALLVFSGEVIRPFAWVLGFGVFIGTFSTIYIAAPVLMAIERRWPGQNVRGVKSVVQAAGTGTVTA